MDAFARLDVALEDFEDGELDKVKVKSFFYVLYFTKDKSDFDDGFYMDFAECFSGADDDEEIFGRLSEELPGCWATLPHWKPASLCSEAKWLEIYSGCCRKKMARFCPLSF